LPADASLVVQGHQKAPSLLKKMILRQLIDRFDEHLLRDPKGGVGVGDPAVNRRLQAAPRRSRRLSDHYDAPPEVHREFLVMAAGDQSRQGDE
jgi:hypothetical protein